MYSPAIDPTFDSYFNGRMKQVFFYITDRCQLRCEQCLYKTTLANRDIPEAVAAGMIKLFASYGARKLTFIGGEPTLYDKKNQWGALFRTARLARTNGFEYIRLDTNGLFDLRFLDNVLSTDFDNLAFSFDGPDFQSHDLLRGDGTFHRSMVALRKACDSDLNVTVTICVHPGNLGRLGECVQFFQDVGVKEVNFHPLFKMGIERDKFTGNTNIDVTEWRRQYFMLKEQLLSGLFKIPVRVAKRFVPIEEYGIDRLKYRYCPVRMGERILVHPNGELRICALGIGSKNVIGRWTDNELSFDKTLNSEIHLSKLGRGNCLSQVADFGENVPLCISHKEGQSEHVWKTGAYGETLQARSALSEYMDDSELARFWSEDDELKVRTP
jgi:sulfatase maturation enzyme AslB (radical SAM superfamily)